jgi:hypothetical protein
VAKDRKERRLNSAVDRRHAMVSFLGINLRIRVLGLGSIMVSAKAVGQGAEAVAKEKEEERLELCKRLRQLG